MKKFVIASMLCAASSLVLAGGVELTNSEFTFPQGSGMVSTIDATLDNVEVLSSKSKSDAEQRDLSMVRCNLEAALAVDQQDMSFSDVMFNLPTYCKGWVSKANKLKSVKYLNGKGLTADQKQVYKNTANWLKNVKY